MSSAGRLVTALVALVGVGAACFSERATSAPPAADPSLCAGSPPAGVVLIRNFSFQPAELRIPAGATVKWVNCEDRSGPSHTSTSDGSGWDSGLIPPGTSFSRTFAQVGRVTYHCEPHPVMKGAVVVE